MRGRGAALVRLMAWLAFVAVGIVGLHKLGASFPIEAITDPGGPTEPALAAALRLIGLAVGYWLAGSTLLYVIARIGRIPAGLRAVQWMTLGPIRRVVDRVAAGAVAVSLTVPLGAWAVVTPGYVPVPAGDSTDSTTPSSSTTGSSTTGSSTTGSSTTGSSTTGPPTTGEKEPPPWPSSSVQSQTPVAPDPLYLPVTPAGELFEANSEPIPGAVPASATAASEVIVRPGDDMWKLAEDHLATLLGRQPTDSEIAPYWLQVIGANLNRIRSGDPDLIFPGEVLFLPPVK